MEAKIYTELEKRENGDWWFIGRRKIISTLLSQHLKNKKNLSIVDIGCGAGDVMNVTKEFGDVIGVDNNKQIIEFNKKSGRNAIIADIKKLPFAKQSFDLVTLLEVLEHLEDDSAALKESCRILKPKGTLILTVPAFPFLWGSHDMVAHHKRRYIKQELVAKLQHSGFKVQKISYMNTFLFPIIFSIRVLKNLFKTDNNKSDFFEYPVLANWLLAHIFSLEAQLLKKINFPFGVSLVAIAQKV